MSSDLVTDRSLMSGRVKRYNTWPTITSQTVGDHCWGVYHVYWRIFGMPTAEVALYIHLHDAEELVVGDNPFPSKRRFPELKTAVTKAEVEARRQLDLPDLGDVGYLPAQIRHRVKVCDLLEMYQFGQQEREMGNLLATPIVERTRQAAQQLAKSDLPDEDHRAVVDWIMTEESRHRHVLRNNGSTY